jgi:hypothetical protein
MRHSEEEKGGEFRKRYVEHEFFVGPDIVYIRKDIKV